MSMVAHRTKQITFDLAIAASTLVKLAHKHDASLHRAVDKAAPRLMEQPWRVVDGVLEITSYSRPNEIHRCDADYCECPANQGQHWCWHRGGYLIVSTLAATGVDVEAVLPLPDMTEIDDLAGIVMVYSPEADAAAARAQARADEMFA